VVSSSRTYPARPPVDPETEALVLSFARENPGWGYDRIAGALKNLGHTVSDQTMGNLLKRNGMVPSPKRKASTTWDSFIDPHKHVMAACDFFTTEVLTAKGLMTYYVLFFIHLGSRQIHIAGVTPNPDSLWMNQIARNVTMADIGFLSNCRYLFHDRDAKFCDSFRSILEACGVKPIRLPPRSPNLNAYAERFVRSIKEECLSHLILAGREGLMTALKDYTAHYHEERNHQGVGNVLLFPSETFDPDNKTGTIRCRERLGGLLKYYYREPAEHYATG
jgi:transposase InsO family protein